MNEFDPEFQRRLHGMSMPEVIKAWALLEGKAKTGEELSGIVRMLCCADLFYLLANVCGRKDMLHPWLYARVREVEGAPNEHLDLWAREHAKSSTITFGLTMQDILKNPEVTFGIFSHTRPIAKAFLRQIMREYNFKFINYVLGKS